MRFYQLIGGMTDVKVLFGDIIAEQTGKGTYVVRKGEDLVSLYEYAQVTQLTPKCYLLFRPKTKKYDLIFASGAMQFGFDFAYKMEKIGRRRKKKSYIAALIKNGAGVYDDFGNFVAFLPGIFNVAIAEDKFLVGLLWSFSEPYAKVYTMWGDFLADGFLSEAIEEAKEKDSPSSQLG
jgi:hypothetical protein